MELATPHPEQNDVRGKLEEGISPYSHKREYPQRQQRHGHNHDLCGDRQVHPHQFRVAHKQEQKHSLYRVAGLQHAAQSSTGAGLLHIKSRWDKIALQVNIIPAAVLGHIVG